ncbi:MAG: ATP-grasp domain-containing protein [Streptosporangiaceae bacterium]|nr:ATP-grasp domain-containing protein [Streptosporangiaceae bacterium]
MPTVPRATGREHLVEASTPAVVLKFDPNVMHHGGLGVIRSLGRHGIPVYGVHEGPWAPAASSRYLRGRCFWQPDPEHADRVIAGLIRLATRIGRRSVLLVTDDAGAIFLAERGAALREWYLFPEPPADLPRRLAGKYSLAQLCREYGVPTPRTLLPESLEQAREFATATGYPLVAKLATPWIEGGKLRSTSVIAGPDQLHRAYEQCAGANAGLMLQEFIPSAPGQDWFFHGYCDAASACRPAFTGVKERSYPADAGLTSMGRSAPNPRLASEIVSLLARLGYRGTMDLDIRFDPRTGQYHLLDFNPRLGAQFRLFRDTAGNDVALAAYLDLTGQRIPFAEQVSGRGFLVENYDPISALAHWRRGDLSPRAWLASLREVDETAWFATDDLRPFGLMCLRMGWRAVSRPFSGFSRNHKTTTPSRMRYRVGRGQTEEELWT